MIFWILDTVLTISLLNLILLRLCRYDLIWDNSGDKVIYIHPNGSPSANNNAKWKFLFSKKRLPVFLLGSLLFIAGYAVSGYLTGWVTKNYISETPIKIFSTSRNCIAYGIYLIGHFIINLCCVTAHTSRMKHDSLKIPESKYLVEHHHVPKLGKALPEGIPKPEHVPEHFEISA